jgi:formamidopyrimidine-DNA glycosylase
MPELPEVETVRRGLAPVLEGARIGRVELRRPDLRFAFPPEFAGRLKGARVTATGRRAKYLLAHLDTGETLVAHLGMSGRFTVVEGAQARGFGDYVYSTGADPKHDHVLIHLDSGPTLVFNDPRRFGYMDLVATPGLDTCTHFARMGPEPLGNAFSGPVLARALGGRRTPIKLALLDQRIVAGLGNIYVCEALFRARISPLRLARDVTAPEADRLAAAIRAVLEAAIAAGGSTLRDFAAADGSLGGFQERFDVYGRESEPCSCGTAAGTVERLVQGARSTFWCPACQQ